MPSVVLTDHFQILKGILAFTFLFQHTHTHREREKNKHPHAENKL